jgi:hypothetical protein
VKPTSNEIEGRVRYKTKVISMLKNDSAGYVKAVTKIPQGTSLSAVDLEKLTGYKLDCFKKPPVTFVTEEFLVKRPLAAEPQFNFGKSKPRPN